MTPTLVASRTALPPEGALRLRPGKAGSAAPAGEFGDEPALVVVNPTLVASRTALPPEGAVLARGGPSRRTACCCFSQET